MCTRIYTDSKIIENVKLIKAWVKLKWFIALGLMKYMGNVRDVIAPNIAKRPQPLFIFVILMYLYDLSPSHFLMAI
jgi:hypothetical protein